MAAISLAPVANANQLALLQIRAESQQLSEHPVWRALLHQRDEDSLIEDPVFILSRANFSAANELSESLELLFSGMPDQQLKGICRYPARYLWLTQQLDIPEAVVPQRDCPEIAEFFARAPADEIALVFASENLTSPSSMMGHVLLKLSGVAADGRSASHAVSFFTQIEGINVPRILFESLVSGKRGFYTLSPYREKEVFYRQREQRNVWEYPLQLSADQKKLIRMHLWELKAAQLTYYFHRYNCATMTRFLLALADPQVLDNSGLWTTPLDLVRAVQSSKLVGAVDALPSDRWLAEALSRQLPDDLVAAAQDAASRGILVESDARLLPDQAFLLLEFSRAWAAYSANVGALAPAATDGVGTRARQRLDTQFPDKRLDLTRYKNPAGRPKDSQWRLGIRRNNGDTLLQLGFLSASHRLEDSSRQSFSESGLQLGDVTTLVNPESGEISLQEMQVYAMTSLTPFNTLTGGFTGRIRLGVETHYDSQLEKHTVANLSGAIGATLRLSRDAIAYGLAAGGFGYAEGGAYPYGEPEVGLIVNEIWGMKSLLNARLIVNQLSENDLLHEFNWTQTKALNSDSLLVIDYGELHGKHQLDRRVGLSIKRYF